MFKVGDIIKMPNNFDKDVVGVILSNSYTKRYTYEILTNKGKYRYYTKEVLHRRVNNQIFSNIGHLNSSEIKIYKLLYVPNW